MNSSLGKWDARPAFENWYDSSPARGWYASDQAYAAWIAAAGAERERCAKQLDSLGCDHCAAALRFVGKEMPSEIEVAQDIDGAHEAISIAIYKAATGKSEANWCMESPSEWGRWRSAAATVLSFVKG